MKEVNLNIPAGTLICFSEGSCSDYGYCGHFVTLENLTPEKIYAISDKAINEARKEGSYSDGKFEFVPNMIRAGYLVEVNVLEIHLGEFGRLHTSLISPNKRKNET